MSDDEDNVVTTPDVVVKDDSLSILGDFGIIEKWGAFFLNIPMAIVFFIELIVIYAGTVVQRTYFDPAKEVCEWSYYIGYLRWMYFAHALAMTLDIGFSFFVGQKIVGNLVPFFNGFAVAVNALCLIGNIIAYTYVFPTNSPVVSVINHPAVSPWACGTPDFINSATAKCEFVNTLSYLAYPPVVELKINPLWNWFRWIMVGFIIFGIIKFILSILVPASTAAARKVGGALLNAYQNIQTGGVTTGLIMTGEDIKQSMVPKGSVVNESKVSYFFGWVAQQKILYPLALILIFVYALLFLPQITWFHQHTQTITWKYTPAVVGMSNVVKIAMTTDWSPFIYYGLVVSNILCLWGNLWVGHPKANIVAIISSGFGIMLNLALMVWNLVMIGTCYVNGLPNNICYDRRWKCQDPISNPNNGCTNDLACTVQKPSSGPDPESMYVFVITIFAFIINLGIFLYALSLRKSINKVKKI